MSNGVVTMYRPDISSLYGSGERSVTTLTQKLPVRSCLYVLLGATGWRKTEEKKRKENKVIEKKKGIENQAKKYEEEESKKVLDFRKQ